MNYDPVDNPKHYGAVNGVECVDIAERFSFNLGNAIKYVWRAGLKDPSKKTEDVAKALWYLERERERLKYFTDHQFYYYRMSYRRNMLMDPVWQDAKLETYYVLAKVIRVFEEESFLRYRFFDQLQAFVTYGSVEGCIATLRRMIDNLETDVQRD